MVVHPEFGGALVAGGEIDQARFEAEVEAAIARLRRLIARQESGLTRGRLASCGSSRPASAG